MEYTGYSSATTDISPASTASTASVPPSALKAKQVNDSSYGLVHACTNVGIKATISTATDTVSAINGLLNIASEVIPSTAPTKQTIPTLFIPPVRRCQPNIVTVAHAINVMAVITALAIAPSINADTVITPASTAHTPHYTSRGRAVPLITASMYGIEPAAEISAPIVTSADIMKSPFRHKLPYFSLGDAALIYFYLQYSVF